MISLARNDFVKRFIQDRATMSALSKKFVGGQNVSAVIEKARTLKSKGFSSSLFNLGEYIESMEVIAQTVSELKSIVKHLAESQLDVHISVDPTQIGYQLNNKICHQHAFDLANEVKTAVKKINLSNRSFLMLDMEDATVTQATIDLYKGLRSGLFPAAITLQAYLHRTESDLKKIIQMGGAVRLVKGAFAEGKNIAFTNRKEIDNNFINLTDIMLSKDARKAGFYPMFATHDDRMIDHIINVASSRKWKKNEYEFEMLYGVRSGYQRQLVRSGEQLRLYLPFGTDWWPYAVRRVGESPKNAKFLIRSLIRK
jgi:proline dehydrogenase